MAFNRQNRSDAVFTPKETLAERIDEESRRRSELRRQQLLKRIVISVVGLLFLGSLTGAYFWFREQPRPAPTPRPEERFSEEVSETVFNYGTLRNTQLELPEKDRFAVSIYDFDTYYYPKGQDHVEEEGKFLEVLREHKSDFIKSWVVVFAGASFENREANQLNNLYQLAQKNNLDLCRRRTVNVAKLLFSQSDLTGKGYWIIPAGEYRLKGDAPDNFDGDSSEVETEEEEQAKALSEEGLKRQRRLIVITIQPLRHTSSLSEQAMVEGVVGRLRERRLLPTNYDHGRAKPAALALSQE